MMRELGWKPSKPFAEMIQEMVDADLAMIRK
jgi:GDP-D-mannose dehydratase